MRPACCFYFLGTLLAWGAWSGGASADTAADCRKSEPVRKITACTQLIKKGGNRRISLAAAFNLRGQGYQASGDNDRALRDYSQAIRLEPGFAAAYNNRGWVRIEMHDYDEAIADLNAAIRLNPKYAYAYNNRGNAYRGRKEFDRAVADYNEAIRLDPKLPYPYNNRGTVRRQSGDLKRAISDFGNAIRVDPKFAYAYMNRGNAYRMAGDEARAIADFRKVVALPAQSAAERRRQVAAREHIARLTKPKTKKVTSRRVALVIGNSSYARVGRLPNPKRDAAAMAATLRRLGFAEIKEIYDADRERMGQALKEFGDAAETAEWAVVFFAGHGLELNGTNYLLPIDARLKRDTHVADEAVSLDRVQAKIDGASKFGLIILDACRNNPFAGGMLRSARLTRSVTRGLASVEPEGNVLIAYAAKHGTLAEDGADGHSPFTAALLAHMEEPGLEVNILFRKVRDDVRNRTQRRQEPFVYGSLGSELLFFRPAPKQ
jgi:tetratricopeptide (TPR) repeat protein